MPKLPPPNFLSDVSLSLAVEAAVCTTLSPGGSGALPEVPGLLPRARVDLLSGTSVNRRPRARLVVASNRTDDPSRPAAGGLAVALGEMMKATDGLWFGWSGQVNDGLDAGMVRQRAYGQTTLAQVDLSQADHDHYYAGFANAVLWPVFHEQVKRAHFQENLFEGYTKVNKAFAATLAPMLRDDDVLWVHDYHLIPLAEELRALNCRQRIGFFNHIPFPSPETLMHIPQHERLVRALCAYDLVGMQVQRDLEKFHEYVELRGLGRRIDAQHLQAFGQTVGTQHFPIGIDAAQFKVCDTTDGLNPLLAKLSLERSKRTLMVSAERLDYTKGVPKRLHAFRMLLQQHPECRDHVTLVQIAPPSREYINAYAATGAKVRGLVNAINTEYGAGDWTPVMHVEEAVDRRALAKVFSLGSVGVVTSVADGMNLVAKEYVAAQALQSPGVLVLSKHAGAAEQLTSALIVDPKDRAGLAEAYHRGLTMPLEERCERHAASLKNVQEEDLCWWRERYLRALADAGPPPGTKAPEPCD